MCFILSSICPTTFKKNVDKYHELIEDAIDCNPDGVGLVIYSNGWHSQLSLSHIYGEIDDLAGSLCEILSVFPAVLHLRFATVGKVSPANCQPFPTNAEGVFFAHNGSVDLGTVSNYSDSRILANGINFRAKKEAYAMLSGLAAYSHSRFIVTVAEKPAVERFGIGWHSDDDGIHYCGMFCGWSFGRSEASNIKGKDSQSKGNQGKGGGGRKDISELTPTPFLAGIEQDEVDSDYWTGIEEFAPSNGNGKGNNSVNKAKK
jgi:hypothetical protein